MRQDCEFFRQCSEKYPDPVTKKERGKSKKKKAIIQVLPNSSNKYITWKSSGKTTLKD